MAHLTPAQVEVFDHEWGYYLLPDGRGVELSFCEETHVYMVRDPFDGQTFLAAAVAGAASKAVKTLCSSPSVRVLPQTSDQFQRALGR